MLVLTRKINEIIRIGDNIQIHVLDIGYGKCRIGIEAPREIPVHREETYNEIKKGNNDTLRTAKLPGVGEGKVEASGAGNSQEIT